MVDKDEKITKKQAFTKPELSVDREESGHVKSSQELKLKEVGFGPDVWDQEPIEISHGGQKELIRRLITPWLNERLLLNGEACEWDVAFYNNHDVSIHKSWTILKEAYIKVIWEEDRDREIYQKDYDGEGRKTYKIYAIDEIERLFHINVFEGALAWLGRTGEEPLFLCIMPWKMRVRQILDREKRAEHRLKPQPIQQISEAGTVEETTNVAKIRKVEQVIA